MERLTNMIKALRCVASQNVEGDCYADIQNYMHITDDKFKRLVCRDGKNLKDFINGKEAVTCPFIKKNMAVALRMESCFGLIMWLIYLKN